MTETYKSVLALDVSGWKKAAAEAKAAIAEVRAALNDVKAAAAQAAQAPPGEINQAAHAAQETGSGVQQAAQDAREAATAFDQVVQDIQATGNALNQAGQDAAETGTAFDSAGSDAQNAGSAIHQVGRDARESGAALNQAGKEAQESGRAFSQAGAQAQSMGANYKQVVLGIGGITKSGMLQFLKYALGIRSVYAMVNKLRAAYAKGMQELSGYSADVRNALGSMSAALTQLRNSIAVAFAPLVTVAAPYITAFISHIADAFNAVGAFFAALTGQSSYTRAVYNYKSVSNAAADAAESAHSAASAQEELNRQLLGFDEVTKLADNSSSGGGSGGGGGGGGASGSGGNGLSFITESIPSGVSDIAQRLRDLFGDIDFGPLRDQWDKLTEAGGRLADVMQDGLAWGVENVLAPLAKWTIEEAAPRNLELLANAANILADALIILKPAFQWVWDNVLQPLAALAANTYTAALDALNAVLSDIDGALRDVIDLMEGRTNIGELFKKWFSASNFASFADDLLNWVQKANELRELLTNPAALTVKLIQEGWTTVGKWVSEKMGGAVSKAVGLAKDGWDSVKAWVSKHIGGAVSKTVGLARDGWTSVKDWVKGSLGGAVSKAISLAKDGWKNVADWVKSSHLGKGVRMAIGLAKGWTGTVAKFLGLDKLAAKFTIKLPKVSVTWSGEPIKLPHFSVKWNAKGGILAGATLFGMAGNTLLGGGEAGREAILPLDSNTGWMDQLADRLAQRMGGSGSNQPIVVQVTLDGRVVAESTVRELHGMTREGRDPLAGLV